MAWETHGEMALLRSSLTRGDGVGTEWRGVEEGWVGEAAGLGFGRGGEADGGLMGSRQTERLEFMYRGAMAAKQETDEYLMGKPFEMKEEKTKLDEVGGGVSLAQTGFSARSSPRGVAYSDEKVANREIRVWHGATENGP
jgi:hypothetical protein